jgi:exo-beta-1,3-glucanase (GH17 family)
MVKRTGTYFNLLVLLTLITACNSTNTKRNTQQSMNETKTASQILGDPNYLAMSYGGYREVTREVQPTVEQLKNDMRILSAMGVKIIRTYNTHFEHAGNVLRAIEEIRSNDSDFEMYVMLGAWIDCENAWTDTPPNHDAENEEANAAEIERAVELANKYPEIVKVLAVGNEAMVKWAERYYVQPGVILKWVNYLQSLKETGKLNSDLWITSSDNFASWGGGDTSYHCDDLEALIKAVDFVSLHTYPMHDTHYNPRFWGVLESEALLPKVEAVEHAMNRALLYAKKQYTNTKKYVHRIDSTKLVHIGETGWASESIGLYGPNGSNACDEYKAGVYYRLMRQWTKEAGITCFYFEAFNEKWKDPHKINGSENHFGLFTIEGEAKYAIWDLVDAGVFDGLARNNRRIRKTNDGRVDSLLNRVKLPPLKQLK